MVAYESDYDYGLLFLEKFENKLEGDVLMSSAHNAYMTHVPHCVSLSHMHQELTLIYHATYI